MILDEIRQYLRDNADPKLQNVHQRFFKEEMRCYGWRSAGIQKLAKERFLQIKNLPKVEIFALCENLWQSGMQEETGIACEWSYALRKQYTPEDFKTFERWVTSYVFNWAMCDTLCNHTIGEFMMMFPEYVSELKRWAKSKNRWVKRAAAVTLIIPARRGLFLEDIFEIADTLLQDKDDLVQKGYGWALKATSEAHEQAVFEYVMKNKAVMPRTALRYAIEKMPADLKKQAMTKNELPK